MSGDSKLDKRTAEGIPHPLRMLGDTEVNLILSFAADLPTQANILEVGPWLGGLTVELARFGQVTVADRFIWTEANARNYPDIAEPNANFRDVFQSNMQAHGIDVGVIETTLPDMNWDGGMLDMAVIDAPRDAASLHGCLRAVAGSLREGAIVMVKHALNMRDLGMGAYIDALAGRGWVSIQATEQPDWCNIVGFAVRPGFDAVASFEDANDLIASAPMAAGFTDPWYGRRLSAFRLGYLAEVGRWNDAFARLSELPKDSENMSFWVDVERHLSAESSALTDADLAVISEFLWVHNDATAARDLPFVPRAGFAPRLSAYWRNNAHRSGALEHSILAFLGEPETGAALSALAGYAGQIFNGHVVEVGSNLGSNALAALVLGAESYRGIEESEPTEMGKVLDASLPHFVLSGAKEDALEAIAKASVLIVGNSIGDRELSEAINARRTGKGAEATVIVARAS